MKRIVSLFIVITIALSSLGQEVKIVDSNNNSYLIEKNGYIFLKEGTTAIIKINGRNRNLYDIDVNNKIFEFEYKLDTLFSNYLKASKVKTGLILEKEDEGEQKILKENINLDKYIPLFQYDVELLASSYKNLPLFLNKNDFKQSLSNSNFKLNTAISNFDKYYTSFILDGTIDLKIKDFITNKKKVLIYLDSIRSKIDTSIFHCTYPFTIYGDAMDINISIKEKAKPDNIIPYNYKAIVYGGFKVDMHVGLVFDFFNPNETYGFKSINADSVKLIEGTKGLSLTPSLAIFANAYIKTKNIIRPGFSIGLGVDSEENVDCYAGISAIAGNNKRFVITTGVSFSNRDKLKTNYEIGEIFANDIRPDSKELTEKVYKAGFFVSVGYNLDVSKKQINK